METNNGHKIAAVIVCYNPSIERLQQSIKTIYKQVDQIFIIDNHSSNINEYEKVIDSKINIIKLDENKGIAYALNAGLMYCKKSNYLWMLTLDQDSILNSNSLDLLYRSAIKDITAIIAPRVIDIKAPDKDINKGLTVITSGCLTNIEIAIKCGGYNNEMFIDYVDHEFCLRLLTKGYKIIKNYDAILYHEIGNISQHKFLCFTFGTTNHPPYRHYYLFRNKIFIYKTYIKYFPKWIFNDIILSFKSLVLIFAFEKERKKNIKFIFWGIKDGLCGNFNRKIVQPSFPINQIFDHDISKH